MYIEETQDMKSFDFDDISEANDELLYEIMDEMSRNAFNKNPKHYRECYGDPSADEQILEDLRDEYITETIGLYSIDKSSLLFAALEKYYEAVGGDMKNEIRDYLDMDDKIYLTTGCGYNVFEQDVLNADGTNHSDRALIWRETWDKLNCSINDVLTNGFKETKERLSKSKEQMLEQQKAHEPKGLKINQQAKSQPNPGKDER